MARSREFPAQRRERRRGSLRINGGKEICALEQYQMGRNWRGAETSAGFWGRVLMVEVGEFDRWLWSGPFVTSRNC